ncbi:HAD family hydrolase [Chloroflexia bacterium SDU3-3]|nr:HAD family hydrolase [Chloroflexia bacterium SDU3-3]
MLRAAIFDMGGTLLAYPGVGDTWRALEEPGIRAVYRYLRAEGHALPVEEDAFCDAMFLRLERGWRQAVEQGVNIRADTWIGEVAMGYALALGEAALGEAALRYASPLRGGVLAQPGAAQVLAALRGRGLRIGLISNTIWPGALHREDLATCGLLQHIDHAIFSGDLGIWKPSPQIFQSMLAALGVAPSEAFFVGDSPQEDIAGAQAVGMPAVWLANREFPTGGIRPDFTITSLTDLLRLPILA